MKLTKDNLAQDDHDTILAYVTATCRAQGYKGQCIINLPHLAELHLSNSIYTANQLIKKMMVKA